MKYSDEHKEFLKKYVPGHSYREITEEFNRRFPDTQVTIGQIKGSINRYHLNTGRNGQFVKGNIPPNKGKKGYHAPGSEKSWFKKGNVPKNHKPVGSERIDPKNGYVYVKVAEPQKWKMKHRIVWENAYGPIPKDHVVVFLDGDKTNFSLDNLKCISRSVNVRMNQNHLYKDKKEFTETGIAIASLIDLIGKRKRGSNGKT